MNLLERCNEQQEIGKGQNLGNRSKKDDCVLDPSIGRDPLIYIKRGVVLSQYKTNPDHDLHVS
jgi:hypothetical protein